MAERPALKDAAGVAMAFIVVLSYVGIGFVQTAAAVLLGVEVKMPPDWMAAMLSLASAALGFLIGKQAGPQLPTNAVLPMGPPYTPADNASALPSAPAPANVPQ